jgi:AcrR family transcriptional regulator
MTAKEILAGAKKLYMRYGIKSVTMDDVARELGISKKTLYQHVDNKTDLVNKIIKDHISTEKSCLGAMEEEASDPIEHMLMIARYVTQVLREVRPAAMYDLQKYYRDAWKIMDKFQQEHVYRTIRANLEKGIDQGLYRDDIDADIIAKLYVGKTMIITDEELFPMREYNRDQLFNEYMTYHLRGILSDQGLKKFKTYQPSFS